MRGMQGRLGAALVAYAVLGVLAAATLEGNFRLATLIFLAGLVLKMLIAIKREQP